jgi:hypothetical protein
MAFVDHCAANKMEDMKALVTGGEWVVNAHPAGRPGWPLKHRLFIAVLFARKVLILPLSSCQRKKTPEVDDDAKGSKRWWKGKAGNYTCSRAT